MKPQILTTQIETPLGSMLAGATPDGICLLDFADCETLEIQMRRIARRLGSDVQPGSSHHLDQLQEELTAYFAGQRKVFGLALVLPGTPFQQSMWKTLCQVPYGETRSYLHIAQQLGRPAASRAVGGANANNPIAVVVPCHRLVGTNGELTGYAGGLWRKQRLQELERSHLED